jgi:hypothetical protein
MRTTIILVALALVATAVVMHFTRGKSHQCERTFDQLKGFGVALGTGMDRGLGGKGDAGRDFGRMMESKRREFIAQCKTWPDDVVDCLADLANAPDSCEQTLSEENLAKLHIDKIW